MVFAAELSRRFTFIYPLFYVNLLPGISLGMFLMFSRIDKSKDTFNFMLLLFRL